MHISSLHFLSWRKKTTDGISIPPDIQSQQIDGAHEIKISQTLTPLEQNNNYCVNEGTHTHKLKSERNSAARNVDIFCHPSCPHPTSERNSKLS